MDNNERLFEDFLSNCGLKNTSQRRLIVSVFFDSGRHVSSEELYDMVKIKDKNVGQATVYRTLKLLCKAGLAMELHFGDGTARYEAVREGKHHDHLICTACGKNIEVFDENIEKLQEALASRYAFSLTAHNMNLYGLCPDCGKPKA